MAEENPGNVGDFGSARLSGRQCGYITCLASLPYSNRLTVQMHDRFMLKAWHFCDVFICDLIEGRRNNVLDVRLREGEKPVKCISRHALLLHERFKGMIAPP
jgi:hypothetical protein